LLERNVRIRRHGARPLTPLRRARADHSEKEPDVTYLLAAIGLLTLTGFVFCAGFVIGCVMAAASPHRDRTAHDATVYAEGFSDGQARR
jgi:hypothetical protein